ncbi:hypothetical protein [Austwickia chelonae]|uniref:hypothetical protein n=1 Tax=Austwickia chelonae TaxID=100225 RepID=UPI0013C357EA|nr:hypothetical protein [Austwickia chelonae]
MTLPTPGSLSNNTPSNDTAEQEHQRTPLPWWALLVVCAAWFGLWCLTTGLRRDGLGSQFTADRATAVLIETVLAAVISVVLVLTHRRYNRVLFARSWAVQLYVVLVVLAIALPFHYQLPLPVFLYMAWMAVSVFWQDYLTFGLLHCYLGERFPTWAVVAASVPVSSSRWRLCSAVNP